ATESPVRFAYSQELTGPRACFYPLEEGNRAAPNSEHYWSAVETLPRERLDQIRLTRLRTILAYIESKGGYYARRWREAGVTAKDVRSLADLSAFPVITKEDRDSDQKQRPPYGTAWTVPPNTQMKFWQTSGTTAAPRLWAETKEDWENGMFLYARSLYAHGVRPGW